MAAVGGDILEITYNHPTLGSGTFFVKSGEDSTFDPGGMRVADDKNNVTGNGKRIKILNNSLWQVTCTLVWDANLNNEVAQLKALQAAISESTWTFTLANGTVWGGEGGPVGDIEGNGNEATVEATFQGGGELTKIVG